MNERSILISFERYTASPAWPMFTIFVPKYTREKVYYASFRYRLFYVRFWKPRASWPTGRRGSRPDWPGCLQKVQVQVARTGPTSRLLRLSVSPFNFPSSTQLLIPPILLLRGSHLCCLLYLNHRSSSNDKRETRNNCLVVSALAFEFWSDGFEPQFF